MGNAKPAWFPDGRLQFITNSPLRARVDQGQLKVEEASRTVPLGTLSRDGKTMYVAEMGNAKTPGVVAAYDAATGERRSALPVRDVSRFLALSPDGRSFAFLAYPATGNQIVRMNVDGTDYRVLYSGDVAGPSVSWSADGTAVLFAQGVGARVRLMRVPVAGGSPEAVGIEAPTRFLAIDASPDGKRIAYSTREGATEVWTLNLPTGTK
jgi:Tol biopolymer transport system component